MKLIVCVACAFGYGPVAKLISICRGLVGYRLIYVGNGVSLELASHEDIFSELIDIDVYTPEGEKEFANLLERDIALLLTVLEPNVVGTAKVRGIPVCYIDSLFWMWDRFEVKCRGVDAYIAQNYFGVDEKYQKFKKDIKSFYRVGPIIDKSYIGIQKKNHLMINFSGMDSIMTQKSNKYLYCEPMVEILLDILKKSEWSKVLFTGNREVMDNFRERYKDIPYEFKHLSHSEFLKNLSEARMILTTPGLTTTYEALIYKTPIRFLPPINYSMLLMLSQYKRKEFSDDFNWDNIFSDVQIEENLPERLGVELVAKIVRRFNADKNAQKKLTSFLRIKIKSVPDSAFQKCIMGEQFSDGVDEVRKIIEKIMEA